MDEPPNAPPPPPGRDPRGSNATVRVPRPNPNANAQKGLAKITNFQVRYDGKPSEFIQKETEEFLRLLVNWCRLRPHVQKQALPPLEQKVGKRKRFRRFRRRG